MNVNDSLLSKYEKAEVVETEDFKAPSGYESFYYKCKDLKKLRITIWNSESSKGTIMLQSGRTEFTEKYFEVVSEFIERGYCVAMMDWRGQGKSSRVSKNTFIGHINSFKHYDDDLNEVISEVYTPHCPKPWIGMGHSMGGCLIASNAANEDAFDSVILCAPMLSMNIPFAMKALIVVFGMASKLGFQQAEMRKPDYTIESGWSLIDFNENGLTSDLNRYLRTHNLVIRDKQVNVGGVTIGWIFAAYLRTLAIKYANWMGRITKPTLLINATKDVLVNSRENVTLCKKTKHLTQIDLPCMHEALMETDDIRDEAWKAIDLFLDSKKNY